MRILSLQFRNLNSLKGDHRIDFQEAPLANAGIFAITGPTGAGKTTILDAITLALYGRAARYDRSLPSEVMSRHTGECFAEVQFLSQGTVYGARWDLRRARAKPNGTLQPPKRMVYDAKTQETITKKSKEVDTWVVEQTGLDYARFLRSVLLAQGEFTAFLKASEKERGHLLEKLTGMEIYAELSQLAHEVSRDKQSRIREFRKQLEHIDLLSSAERHALERERDQGKLRVTRVEKVLQRERARMQCLQEWKRHQARREQHRQGREQFERDQATATPWRERWKRHQAIEPHAECLHQWRHHHSQLEDTQREQRRLRIQCQERQEALTQLEKRAQQASARLAESEERLQHTRELQEKISPLDQERSLREEQRDALTASLTKQESKYRTLAQELEEERRSWKSHQARQETLRQWLQTHAHTVALQQALPDWQRHFDRLSQKHDLWRQQAEELGELKQRGFELAEQLKQHREALGQALSTQDRQAKALEALQNDLSNRLPSQTLSDVEASQQRLRDERLRFETLLNHSRQYLDLRQRQEALSRQQTRHRQALSDAREELSQCESRLKTARKTRDLQRQLVQRGAEIRQLREALRAGQPCEVCGSTQHPWQDQKIEATEQADLEKSEAEVTAATAKREALLKEITRLSTELQHVETQHAEAGEGAVALEEAFAQQAPQHPQFACEDHENLAQHVETLKQAESELNQRLLNIRKIQRRIEEARAEQDASRSKVQRLEQTLASEEGKRAALHQQTEAAAQSLELGRQAHASALEALSQALPEQAPAIEDLNTLETFLTQTQEEVSHFQRQQKEEEAALTDCTRAQQSVNALEKQQAEGQQRIDEIQGSLRSLSQDIHQLIARRKALAGERDVRQERNALEENVKQSRLDKEEAFAARDHAKTQLSSLLALQKKGDAELETLATRKETLLETLQTLARAQGFLSVEALLEAFLSPDEAQALAQQDRALRDREVSLKASSTQLEQSERELLDTYRRLYSGSESPQTEDWERTRIRTEQRLRERDTATKAVWKIEQQLDADTKQQAKLEKERQQLVQAEEEGAQWEKLNSLIGSSDGSVFSRFAQSLTLKRLVALANSHLQRLTDRYRILCAPGADLEIQVIDRYQANAVRSMQSLSGGEGFLASLALALGLAEIAGSRGQIESLFIDEGFGTLDSDSLEIAIRALERLQTQNKTIGVISHTALLKERIRCQIHVTRQRGGVSALSVVSQ